VSDAVPLDAEPTPAQPYYISRDPTEETALIRFKASLFGLSHHLESQIDQAGDRGALMVRKHEALDDSLSQGRLAVDRIEGFLGRRARA